MFACATSIPASAFSEVGFLGRQTQSPIVGFLPGRPAVDRQLEEPGIGDPGQGDLGLVLVDGLVCLHESRVRLSQLRLGLGELSVELRRLDDRQQISRLDDRTDIDEPLCDVTRVSGIDVGGVKRFGGTRQLDLYRIARTVRVGDLHRRHKALGLRQGRGSIGAALAVGLRSPGERRDNGKG